MAADGNSGIVHGGGVSSLKTPASVASTDMPTCRFSPHTQLRL